MRNNMITVLTEDYVRMARAKGLKPWRIMWTTPARNAILPNLVGFAMSLGFVVGGAILVEFVFNYPGVGWMFLQSVENQDYALMQALFLLITVTVLLAILAADVATAILDPRTRDAGDRALARAIRSSPPARPSAPGRRSATQAERRADLWPRASRTTARRSSGSCCSRFFVVLAVFPGQIAPDDPTRRRSTRAGSAPRRTTCSARPRTARTSSRSSSAGRGSRS